MSIDLVMESNIVPHHTKKEFDLMAKVCIQNPKSQQDQVENSKLDQYANNSPIQFVDSYL
jgi:hypothetical protein